MLLSIATMQTQLCHFWYNFAHCSRFSDFKWLFKYSSRKHLYRHSLMLTHVNCRIMLIYTVLSKRISKVIWLQCCAPLTFIVHTLAYTVNMTWEWNEEIVSVVNENTTLILSIQLNLHWTRNIPSRSVIPCENISWRIVNGCHNKGLPGWRK